MAAITPSMAAQPLMRSAFSFIVFLQSVVVNNDSAIFMSENKFIIMCPTEFFV